VPRRVAAFGEKGGPLSIPAPLVRVPLGTVVHATVHNTLPAPLYLHGLCDRSASCDAVAVAAGATHEARFTLGAVATLHYWADLAGSPLDAREGIASQLGGAIVVDPVGAAPSDRVFVLGLLHEESASSESQLTVINGRSWPHTEPLEYAVGDTVRWRVVNLTEVAHPMHLHGFYFGVASSGDGVRDTPHPTRSAVTERVQPGGTRTLTWVPERPGNWLFHCHMLVHHVVGVPHGAPDPPAANPPAIGMQGLVLGIRVTGAARAEDPVDRPRRRLRLVVAADTRHGAIPSYRVDLVAGMGPAPRLNARAVPGPVMVLTRGEPVAVEVINRLAEPTAIHWHGIEL
jgi:FtsP/CotA-like multicopper oxidase with cupredoxin domain